MGKNRYLEIEFDKTYRYSKSYENSHKAHQNLRILESIAIKGNPWSQLVANVHIFDQPQLTSCNEHSFDFCQYETQIYLYWIHCKKFDAIFKENLNIFFEYVSIQHFLTNLSLNQNRNVPIPYPYQDRL